MIKNIAVSNLPLIFRLGKNPIYENKLPFIWSCCLYRLIFLVLLCCFLQIKAEARTTQPAGYGYVDSVTESNGLLIIQGWAGATIPSQRTATISIQVGSTNVYEGRFERLERSDVVNATGRADWLRSGWRVTVPMPSVRHTGTYPVHVAMKLDSGDVIDLPLNSKASQITLNSNPYLVQQVVAWCALIILSGLVCVVFYYGEMIAKKITIALHHQISACALVATALLVTFAVFVGIGFTGSSLSLGLNEVSFVEGGAPRILGKPKPIRSDEWAVITPLAAAQANHFPPFPIVNQNLGSDGQNMLIVGMTGVPVKHLSAFAKPATWGFYLFDFKRALAWYWWFPLFGCLFSLWGVFSLLAPGHWRLGILTALWFCLSPYVIAWSDWPAYTVFFPSVALVVATLMLRTKKVLTLIPLGLILGLSLAGFALVLYPPSQIPLAYLYALILIGLILRDRLYTNFNLAKLCAFSGAGLLAGGIIWAWWIDAYPAVMTMVNTIYPGQRNMVVGGTVVLSDLLRGFTNIATLYKLEGVYTNQSEIASFLYQFLPALFLAGVLIIKRKLGLIAWFILGFIGWTLIFMFLGFPALLAKVTFWGRVPASRADLALGLAFILLCGFLLATHADNVPTPTSRRRKIAAFLTACTWAGIVFYAINKLPDGVLVGISPGIAVILFVVIVISGTWLALGETRKFFIITLTLTMATALAFNPIVIVPDKLAVSRSVHDILSLSTSEGNTNSRVLVLESQIPAMMLLASGVPVANGIFYYPQKLLWSNLDPGNSKLSVYNRYQHLLFTSDDVESNKCFRLESPQADVVKVAVNLKCFDFRLTGAQIITAPVGDEALLKENPTVRFIRSTGNWSWFRIIK